jgi:AraC-like DNA-binding protein
MGDVGVERVGFASRDLEEVQDLIARRYVDHRPRMLGNGEDFEFRSWSAGAGGLTVDRATYLAQMAMRTAPFGTVLVINVLDGHFGVGAGRQSCRIGPGEALMYLPGAPLEILFDRIRYQVAQLPMEQAARLAERRGVRRGRFRFEAMLPVSEPMGRHWQATIDWLEQLLRGTPEEQLPALMVHAAMETAASAVLETFPNTTMTQGYVAGPGVVEPSAVRRAMEFIDGHAGETITVDEIAAAAGVGVRGLQAAFRRHKDMTPLAYVRRVRLEHVRRELSLGRTTVSRVARRWGFLHPGRFAAEYRAAFGELPSHTAAG